ncbi:MAG: hypothetical protein IJZ35_08260 [Clostridia bacterium]|nr:hypothetical protein [Clostridia bacterium]
MAKDKSFKFGLTVSCVILLIPIVYIIVCLFNSYIVSGLLLLIPVISFVLSLILVLIKKIPNIIKVILPILILLVTLFVFLFFSFFGVTVEFRAFDGVDEINEYYTDFNFDEFGEYESISSYKYREISIFPFESDTTILKYDKVNFEESKQDINSTYAFYSEKSFTFEDFDFKVIDINDYPTEIELVGVDNESCEIAYVTFRSSEITLGLDDIEPLDEFLNFYCGWEYVLKERS